MNCSCGCGTKVRRQQIDLNLQASEIALELLAWDKARAAGKLGRPAADDAERVIERGADCYQRLILALHGEPGDCSLEEGKAWLRDSGDERREREYMTEKGGIFAGDKLLLIDEDLKRLDRANPELSFTGRPEPDTGGDIVSRLERLGNLRAKGVISDEEFATAKARVLGQG